MFDQFIQKVSDRMKLPLPGETFHLQMAPSHRLPTSQYDLKKLDPRVSSVLMMLYPENNAIKTLFIVRSSYDGKHSAQIGFPGGKQETGDESLYHTAVRETHEEIGIDVKDLNFIGKLSDVFIPVSNFLVTPYLVYLKNKPALKINEREVAGVIEVELFHFFKSDIKKVKEMLLNECTPFEAPYYDIDGQHLWGATAMMISEVMEIILQSGFDFHEQSKSDNDKNYSE